MLWFVASVSQKTAILQNNKNAPRYQIEKQQKSKIADIGAKPSNFLPSFKVSEEKVTMRNVLFGISQLTMQWKTVCRSEMPLGKDIV